MHLVALAWIYVALMMAAAEVIHPNGTWLGALFTFLLYGVLPLGLVLYILGTSARRRARHLREQAEAAASNGSDPKPAATPEAPSPHAADAASPETVPRP